MIYPKLYKVIPKVPQIINHEETPEKVKNI